MNVRRHKTLQNIRNERLGSGQKRIGFSWYVILVG